MSDLRDHTKPCEHGFVRPHWEPDDSDLWPEDIDYDEISPTELCPGGERVTDAVRRADADTIEWCSQHDNPIKWGEHCWLGGMKPAPGARNFPDPEPCVVETPPRHFVGGSR